VWLGGAGNWNDATKWAGNLIPNTSAMNVRVDNGSATASNVTLNQDATVGSIQLDAADTLNVNSGRTLTIAGTAASVLAGNVTNSGAITLQGNTATLTVGATHTGTFNIATGASIYFSGGTHTLNNPTGSFTGGGTAIVTAGSLVAASADTLTGAKLSITNGAVVNTQAGFAKAITLNSVATSGNGKLDLQDNSAVIRSMSLAQVQSAITSGFAGGLWNGGGIASSTAAADASHRTALGYASNADLQLDSFEGVNGLNNNDVLVKFTYYGDATLDGEVTLDDFNQWLGQFANPAPGQNNWLNGDFDYSASVTLDDFNLWLDSFQNQGGRLSQIESAIGSAAGLNDAERQIMLAAVEAIPEPTSLGLLAAAALGLMIRRQRRFQASPHAIARTALPR
jgi:hypothetical protein